MKRYEPEAVKRFPAFDSGPAIMRETPAGGWVRYEDAAGLLGGHAVGSLGNQAMAAAGLIDRANNVLWLAEAGHQQDFELQAKGLAVAVLQAFGATPVKGDYCAAAIEPGGLMAAPPGEVIDLMEALRTSLSVSPRLSCPDGDSPDLPGVVDEDGGDW